MCMSRESVGYDTFHFLLGLVTNYLLGLVTNYLSLDM